MMCKQFGAYRIGLLAFLVVIVFAGCAVAEQPTPQPTVDLTVPLGYPGHPVLHNAEWSQTVQTVDGVDMLLVPTGCFMMGSTTGDVDEQPIYAQCFKKPYWI